MKLPCFRYHPNPIETGSIVQTDRMCECCGKDSGYRYNSVLYAAHKAEVICPWCIADGSAARKFEGQFLDDMPLKLAGIPQPIIDEVCLRTPGYNSWQQQIWQSHCNDACEFHGDATVAEVVSLSGENLSEFLEREDLKPEFWEGFKEHYSPGSDVSIFRFVCRHCCFTIYTIDFS